MLESGAGDLCQCSLGAKTFRKEGKLLSLTPRGNCVICCCEPGRVCCLPFLYATRICVHGCVLWSEPFGGFSRGVSEGFRDCTSMEEALLPGFPEIEPLPGKLSFSCAFSCAAGHTPALPMWATLGMGQLAAGQLAWAD